MGQRGVVRRNHCQAERCPDVDRHTDDRGCRSRADVFEIVHGTLSYVSVRGASRRSAQMTTGCDSADQLRRALQSGCGTVIMPCLESMRATLRVDAFLDMCVRASVQEL